MPCKCLNLLAGVIAATSLLAGCAAPLASPPPTEAAATRRDTSPGQQAESAAAKPVDNAVSASPSVPITAAANDSQATVGRVLAFADRIRSMSPTELAPEFARLGDPRNPSEQMQLALALAQLRQTPELIRAQDMLTRLLANASPEAIALHPLARLLATRFGEQRRFEDLLDKQSQQTRDTQKRLDQTSERLEALKAIERSLGGRAPTAAPSGPAAASTPGTPSVRPRAAP